MANSRTVLSQLLQWIPRDEFQKGVNEYDGDKKVRRLSCWAQFVSMLFGQLAGHNSLRAIEAGLKGAKLKLYHLRIAHEIRRSTLSDANDKRDSRIFEQVFFNLLPKVQRLAPRNHLKLKGPVLALDSTTIALCLELSPWAKFHHGKGAMKLHMAVDIAGDLPTVMVMTPGKVSDVRAAKGISFAPGTLLIMDRGYVDFKWMWELAQQGIYFVTRMKKGTRFKVREWKKTNRTQGIIADQIVRLKNEGYEGKIRKVSYRDPETGHKYIYFTNRFDLASKTICDLYKARWQVELFFKTMKQQLRVKKFSGTSVKNLSQKLDRLLDAHLDGSIEKSEYLGRKMRFLNEKIQIEEKLAKLNTGATAWLEPCAQFLKAASRATLLATNSNRGAKLKFVKFAGSNHRLCGRAATWAWQGPWDTLAQNSRNFMALDGVLAEEMGSRNFFNSIGFQDSSPSINKLSG